MASFTTKSGPPQLPCRVLPEPAFQKGGGSWVPGSVSVLHGDASALMCPSEPLEWESVTLQVRPSCQLFIDTVALKIQDINLNRD